jgi:hypothetical protein
LFHPIKFENILKNRNQVNLPNQETTIPSARGIALSQAKIEKFNGVDHPFLRGIY